jgi:glutathione peroxidase
MNLIRPAALLTAAALAMNAATPLQEVKIQDIDGKETTLKAYEGKVLLVVNVASKCGLTPQYEQLQATYEKYKDKGLVVLGFPCNQFGAQEPGTPAEIKTFCASKYSVTFPLFAKLNVNPPEQHPLYAELSGDKSPFPGKIEWNFGKFLVGRDGKILKRFSPRTKPDEAEVTAAIESALAAETRRFGQWGWRRDSPSLPATVIGRFGLESHLVACYMVEFFSRIPANISISVMPCG